MGRRTHNLESQFSVHSAYPIMPRMVNIWSQVLWPCEPNQFYLAGMTRTNLRLSGGRGFKGELCDSWNFLGLCPSVGPLGFDIFGSFKRWEIPFLCVHVFVFHRIIPRIFIMFEYSILWTRNSRTHLFVPINPLIIP